MANPLITPEHVEVICGFRKFQNDLLYMHYLKRTLHCVVSRDRALKIWKWKSYHQFSNLQYADESLHLDQVLGLSFY